MNGRTVHPWLVALALAPGIFLTLADATEATRIGIALTAALRSGRQVDVEYASAT